MNAGYQIKKELEENGFAIVDDCYNEEEIASLLSLISEADSSNSTFRKTTDLFAIRQFLKEVPNASHKVFTEKVKQLIYNLFGSNFFVVKSIYFDKPETSNWFVAYHQDLTISVDQKKEIDGFGPWTKKQSQFAVQPPLSILQDNFTMRIHLDHTDENNGALKVIPQSHLKGIYRSEHINWMVEKEVACSVGKGGIMLMKPLLLHSSARTTNHARRRVLHIEFSRSSLPNGLTWAEYLPISQ